MKVWMLTAALAVQVLAARAAEFYVDRWSGSDANDGAAPERAVATLARGVSLLRSGDTLVLASGSEPYFETLNLGKLSGEPGRPVKVKGNGAVLSGLAPMPAGASWGQMYGVSLLCGIGFTMSLFIGGLAFEAAGFDAPVRLGVLGGSLLAAAAGYIVFRFTTDPAPNPGSTRPTSSAS